MNKLDQSTYAPEAAVLAQMTDAASLSPGNRHAIVRRAAEIVRDIRSRGTPGLMEVFLAEYGLSTDEGIALMCLAEALLRVPDARTIDALIEDKIAPSDWGRHAGHSTSPLVNASTWALMLTGRVLKDAPPGPVAHLRGAVKRLGEPVIRTAVGRAMKEMGRQFVLGETIASAMKRAEGMERRGYTYSYDMLGEAARTEADAQHYLAAYSDAIAAIGTRCTGAMRDNPGISIKLSALHPRYEVAQEDRVMEELTGRLHRLALEAKSANMGLNIDAEEANRLTLSLRVIETVLSEPDLAGWDGFGLVVQAYGKRAAPVIDWAYDIATRLDRRITLRLVKGAYWDTEIKRAQVAGLDEFPVFTTKAATDVSYLGCARKLLGMTDRIYPQFATHNAHTTAAILHMGAANKDQWEFQRLHGMGEALHQILRDQEDTRCRIYAPVGAHRDLLAYLVRRLLENGANSSFVNQLVDESVPPEVVAADPFEALGKPRPVALGTELFQPERPNSRGFDLAHGPTLTALDAARAPFRTATWAAAPLLAAEATGSDPAPVTNPADPSDQPGTVRAATEADVDAALAAATPWDAPNRAEVLNRAADLYEANFGELFALLHREAGKTPPDAVAELREAVDFLRYYAARIPSADPAGRFTCISPWNFPLAIFTGQVSAALACGNAVLAKPAEQTPLIAHRAVQLMHEAGVPRAALQLLPGDGGIGAALTSDPRVDGVAFTGSTETAQAIRRAMADHLSPGAPLIAETGGLNAMIVDSTALPEQAVQAIVESAFQSAGQRCSALRCLYVQEDIAPAFTRMLTGAMAELQLGAPWDLSSDVGPVIDEEARAGIAAHVDTARVEGRVIAEGPVPNAGTYIAPTLIRVPGIEALGREIFGPVLHMATFKGGEIDRVIDRINATGYGLTFGLMTRIDDRVQRVADRVQAGNIYVNRNQIGAIVGSQPFGGEGLSGTGPKAGGPHYLTRFCKPAAPDAPVTRENPQTLNLPGPTGEENQLTTRPRAPILCAGPGEATAAQVAAVEALGGTARIWAGDPSALETETDLSGVLYWGDAETARQMAQALSRRPGPILPLITGRPDAGHVLIERHVCIDTTAAGGNAKLLGEVS